MQSLELNLNLVLLTSSGPSRVTKVQIEQERASKESRHAVYTTTLHFLVRFWYLDPKLNT